MAPWSVMARAGMPSSAARSNSAGIRDAPSSSEYSVCVCRWTKLFPTNETSRCRPSSPLRRGRGRRSGMPEPLAVPRGPSLCSVRGNYNRVILSTARPQGVGENSMQLSYSRIDTYETCPAKFKFQYEDRVPGRPSPVLSFGDSLHRALYHFHNRPVPVAPSLPDLHELLESVWVPDGLTDPSEERMYLDHGKQILAQYHRDNAAEFRIPAALEHRFSVDVEGVQINGVIDRMDRLPGGGYEIVDYKTNRRLPPMSRVDTDLQLSIYWLAAREIWGIEPERLTLYYLLPGQRMSTTRSPEQADELRRRIRVVAERIAAAKFEPRENPLCNWCDYQALCPVFRHKYEKEGGDPAPRMTEPADEWVALKREGRREYKRLDEPAALINACCEEHGSRRSDDSD